MNIIFFSLVVSVIILFVNVKNHLETSKKSKELLSSKNYECYKFYYIFRVLYALVICIGAISIFLGINNKDDTAIAVGIASISIFLGEYINSANRYCFYYNDESFIYNAKRIRYKSIKSIQKLKIPFAFIQISTINNEKTAISPKSFKLIKDKLPIKTN